MLGATPVTYGEGLVERVRAVAPQGVDAVFDVAGKGALPDAIELRGGTTDRVVTIADPGAAGLGVVFSGGAVSEDAESILAEQARLAADGTLRVEVAKVLPLEQAAQAQALSEEGHVRGSWCCRCEARGDPLSALSTGCGQSGSGRGPPQPDTGGPGQGRTYPWRMENVWNR